MDAISVIITVVIVLVAALSLFLGCLYITKGIEVKMHQLGSKIENLKADLAAHSALRNSPGQPSSPGIMDSGAKLDQLGATLKRMSGEIPGVAVSVTRSLEGKLSVLERIPSIEASIEGFSASINRLQFEKDQLSADFKRTEASLNTASDALRASEIKTADLGREIDSLRKQKTDAEGDREKAHADLERIKGELEQVRSDLRGACSRLEELEASARARLSHLLSQGILDSPISQQVEKLYAESALGKEEAIRAMSALFQLRSSMLPGSGPDDALVAVKALGSALHAVWSAEGLSPKESHARFAQWQGVLCSLPGVGFQLVVPDLGQGIPQNVTAPAGVTKVNEVQLWIVKSSNGSVYARGIVR